MTTNRGLSDSARESSHDGRQDVLRWSASLHPDVVIGTTIEAFARHVRDPEHAPSGHLVAIAWVLDPVRRRLLLLDHRTRGWSCPGGHLEPGEHPRSAACRELHEETGFRLAPVSDRVMALSRGHGCTRPGGHDDVHWTVGYRFHTPATRRVETEPDQPARWFGIDRLPSRRADDVDAVVAHLDRTGWTVGT